jgi:4-amino-4-deoxy-L-arabinose transferase-like glycosyltransferase
VTRQSPHSARWIVGLAILLRLAVFPFAENKHGDAPMRALIAERLNLDARATADPRTYCQFGPLHPALMRPFIALDPDTPRSSRYLSLLAGIAVFFPFLRLARRLAGDDAASLAALALAVSPLHIQASTTAASEALYLLLMVACLERLTLALHCGMRRTFAVAGVLASLAAVTRYDAWLAFPVLVAAAWWQGRGPDLAAARQGRSLLGGLALFSAVAAVLPLAWIGWGARATDDPIFFEHYITRDHAQLAAAITARYGPALARARQVGIWALSFAGTMSLPLLYGAAASLRRFRAQPAVARMVAVAALAPPAIYLAQGLSRLSFEPLPRFALIPGTLLLPAAAAALLARWPAAHARARLGGAVAASAVVFSVAVLAAAWGGGGRVWSGAESLAPLTRLDGEDRQLADHLRAHRRAHERVFIERLDFADIVIAHAARVPAEEMVNLSLTLTPADTAAETFARTGATWLAAYDGGPGSWGQRLAAGWPADGLRFGHWKLARAGGPPQ